VSVRQTLRVVAGILLAAGAIGVGVSLVLMLSAFAQVQSQAAGNEAVLGASLGDIVFAGILWVLIDIANAVDPHKPPGS